MPAIASLLSLVKGTLVEATWTRIRTGPMGRPCWEMVYDFQLTFATHSVIAHAPCWYMRGTRFANLRIIAFPSGWSLPPYPIAASTTNGWPE